MFGETKQRKTTDIIADHLTLTFSLDNDRVDKLGAPKDLLLRTLFALGKAHDTIRPGSDRAGPLISGAVDDRVIWLIC